MVCTRPKQTATVGTHPLRGASMALLVLPSLSQLRHFYPHHASEGSHGPTISVIILIKVRIERWPWRRMATGAKYTSQHTQIRHDVFPLVKNWFFGWDPDGTIYSKES